MRYRFRCQLSSLPPPTYQRFILWRGNNISHRHKNSTIHQTVIYSAVFVPISLIFPPFHPLPFSLSLVLVSCQPLSFALERSRTLSFVYMYLIYIYVDVWRYGEIWMLVLIDQLVLTIEVFDGFAVWYCTKFEAFNEESRIWELMEFSFKLIRNDDILYVIKRWYFLYIRSSLIYIGSLYLSCKI